jgi:hypothetical protein
MREQLTIETPGDPPEVIKTAFFNHLLIKYKGKEWIVTEISLDLDGCSYIMEEVRG